MGRLEEAQHQHGSPQENSPRAAPTGFMQYSKSVFFPLVFLGDALMVKLMNEDRTLKPMLWVVGWCDGPG